MCNYNFPTLKLLSMQHCLHTYTKYYSIVILYVHTHVCVWYEAVSYTHLDVYKRQEVYHILSNSAGLQSILEHLSTHQQADPKLISIITRLEAGDVTVAQYYNCLLYTSRCV